MDKWEDGPSPAQPTGGSNGRSPLSISVHKPVPPRRGKGTLTSPLKSHRSGGDIVYMKELERNMKEVCSFQDEYNTLKHENSLLSKVALELQTQTEFINSTPTGPSTAALSTNNSKAALQATSAMSTIEEFNDQVVEIQSRTDIYTHILRRSKERKRELHSLIDVTKKRYAAATVEEERVFAMTRKLENDLTNIRSEYRQLREEREQSQGSNKDILEDLEYMLHEQKKLIDERDQTNIRRGEIIANAQGDLDEEGEKALKTELVASKLKKIRLMRRESEIDHKISMFEENYQRIKMATGINDIGEILDKLSTQQATHENIKIMTLEADKKISSLHTELKTAEQVLREVQFSGLGNLGKQRQNISEYETERDQVSQSLKASHSRVNYISRILNRTISTIKYIGSRLREITDDSINVDDIKEENFVSSLIYIENKLIQLNNGISGEYRGLKLAQIPLRQQIHVEVSSTADRHRIISPQLMHEDVTIHDQTDEDDSLRQRSKMKGEVEKVLNEAAAKRKKLQRKVSTGDRTGQPTPEELEAIEEELQKQLKAKLKGKSKALSEDGSGQVDGEEDAVGASLSGNREASHSAEDTFSPLNKRRQSISTKAKPHKMARRPSTKKF